MRSAGLVAAILVVGCNQIFGLNQTSVFDARIPPPDGGSGSVLLTLEVEDTGSNGAPVAITLPVIVPSPTIQIAAGDAALTTVTYVDGSMPNTVAGSIPVPLLDGDGQGHVDPYRFVYQLDATSIPHEVQWNLQAGHIVVPVFGHPDRLAPPTGSGYEFKPTGAPTAATVVVAFTTGIWTTAHGAMGAGDFSYVFPTASTTLDGGALGTPTVVRGDSEYLVEVDGDMTCGLAPPPMPQCVGTFSTAFATMQVALMGGTTTLGPSTWKAAVAPTSFALPAFAQDGRIHDALGSGLGLFSEADTFLGGQIPSTVMPAFTIPGANGGLDTTMLAQLAFYSTVPRPDMTMQWVDPFPLGTTVPAVVVSRLIGRNVGSGTMASGLQAIFTPQNMIISSFEVPAAMPSNAMIGGAPLTADNVGVDGTGDFLTLTFTPEMGHTDDDYLVTLFDVGTVNTPLRTFQVLLPSVRIPTDILTNGHTYAVQIVGRNGFPGAQVGDYTIPRAAATFSTATATPGTFVVTK